MIAAVTGGASSKKSEYAEAIVMAVRKKPPVYLATMINSGKEDEKIVARHRELRAGKGFVTVEKSVRLYEARIPDSDTILLEDAANLVANEFFSYPETVLPQRAYSEVKKGLDFLASKAQNLVIVTGNVFEDGYEYDETMRSYLKVFGDVNRYIASISDCFAEIVCGCPVFYKGSSALFQKALETK